MTEPMVTAVMVTGHDLGRRQLALATAQAFLQQTYANAELLILNQGSSPLLPEPTPRVREVMDGAGLVVGALRNLAWQYATGDLMTCWDDDDVHHLRRIAVQVSHFVGRAVALQSELVLHLGTGEAFAYFRRNGFENSLLWPRDCTSRYQETPKGSDSHFWNSLVKEMGGVAIDNPPLLYVRLYRGRNIWDEDHLFGMPRRVAADPQNRNVAVRPPSPDEQRVLNDLLPRYRKLVV